MTQEEKFEEAKRLYETANADQRYVLESLFPELKESEDERTRKELINYLDNFTNSEDRELVDKFIAYLERQCEQKPYGRRQECVDCQFNYAGECKGSCGIKRGEYKPADKKGMNLVEDEMTPFQKKVFCIIDTTIEEEQGLKQVCDELFALASNEIKQKPAAWSEEDKTVLDNLIYSLANDRIGNNRDEYVDWLKSLKDRVQPKPKQKWSEEDEEMFKSIISLCDEKMKSTSYQSVIDHAIDAKNWLKHLKDRVQQQLQWKPSDEQIKALETTLYTNMSRNDEKYSVLSEFVAELKKLKG